MSDGSRPTRTSRRTVWTTWTPAGPPPPTPRPVRPASVSTRTAIWAIAVRQSRGSFVPRGITARTSVIFRGDPSDVVGREGEPEAGAGGRTDESLPGASVPAGTRSHSHWWSMWYSMDSQLARAAPRWRLAAMTTMLDAAWSEQGRWKARARSAIRRPSLIPPQAATSNWTNSTALAVISSRKRSSPYSFSLPQTGIGPAAWTRACPATS